MKKYEMSSAVSAGRSDVVVVVLCPNVVPVIKIPRDLYYYPGPIHDTFGEVVDYVRQAKAETFVSLYKGISKHNLYRVGYSG